MERRAIDPVRASGGAPSKEKHEHVGGPEPRLVFGDETSVGLALTNGANRPAVLDLGGARAKAYWAPGKVGLD